MEVSTNWLEPLPPGFRFHPTHEEAIKYYLIPKVLGYKYEKIPDNMIPEVDILRFEPWDLAALLREKSIISTANSQDEKWWFFCQQIETPRVRAVHRSTQSGSGYWKKTGKDLMIKASDNNIVIGSMKNEIFHKGRHPNGIKTNWVIHKYHAHVTEPDDTFPIRMNLVLCSLKHSLDQKADISEEQEQGASFWELENEAMMSSLLMPLVEQESQVRMGSSDPQQQLLPSVQLEDNVSFDLQLQQLLQQLRQSESNVSFDLQQLQQLLQPSLQSENNITFGLQQLPQLIQPLLQSENNVSFDLHWLKQLLQPSFRSENSSGSNSTGISLDDDFTVADESNHLKFFLSNSEDDEDNVPVIHQQGLPQLQPSSPSENSNRQLSGPRETMFSIADSYCDPVQMESMFGNGEDGQDEEFIKTVPINSDYFGGDQMQMECGQTSSLHTELAAPMDSQRVQTTNTIHCVIPLDEKKRFVWSKVHSRHALSAKPMVPHKKLANDVRVTERDAQNVIKHELAATKIKLEHASLDESSPKAKVVEINEQRGATISPQKKGMKETEQDGALPKTKRKSSCEDTEISPFHSLVYLRNAVIGIILLIAITYRVLYF